jgi:hypothetical protein
MTDAVGAAAAVVLRRGQARDAADAIAAGHANYPSFRHLFPDDRRRPNVLRTFLPRPCAMPSRSVRCLPYRPVVASTQWRCGCHRVGSPGRRSASCEPPPPLPGSWRPRPVRFRRSLGTGQRWKLPTAANRIGTSSCCPYDRSSRVVASAPRWWSRSLRAPTREGVPCRVETADPANVSFYRRLGFEEVDPAFAVIPGGPSLTTFHRSPPTGTGDPSGD